MYQHDLKKASAGRASVATPAATKLTKAEKTTTLPASAAQKAASVARAELDKKKEQESLFPYSLLHLGGDEVSYTCWEQSPQVLYLFVYSFILKFGVGVRGKAQKRAHSFFSSLCSAF